MEYIARISEKMLLSVIQILNHLNFHFPLNKNLEIFNGIHVHLFYSELCIQTYVFCSILDFSVTFEKADQSLDRWIIPV